MRDKVHFRWCNSWIDLCGDGRFNKEMVKGSVKKILQRDTRLRLKKELDEDIKFMAEMSKRNTSSSFFN
jgi:hypothetical protein